MKTFPLNKLGLGGVLLSASLCLFSGAASAVPVNPGTLGPESFGETGLSIASDGAAPEYELVFPAGVSADATGGFDVLFEFDYDEVAGGIPTALWAALMAGSSLTLTGTIDGGIAIAPVVTSNPAGQVATLLFGVTSPGLSSITDLHLTCGVDCSPATLTAYSITGGDNGRVELVQPAPAPGGLALLAGGLLALGAAGRRRAA